MTTSHARDTRAPSHRRVRTITAVATCGALAFGYDTGVIAGALPLMTLPSDQGGLDLTPLTEGLVSASLIVGAAVGALLGGRLADRQGRRRALFLLALVFLVGALGTALAPGLAVMVLFRFVLGVAVGGASATVPMFVAEIAPPAMRAALVSRNELMIVTGQLTAYTSNAVIAALWPGNHAWRWMLALAAVPAIALWIGMFFVPESPRWFAAHGRTDDARRVLQDIRGTRDVEDELDEITAVIGATDRSTADQRADLRIPWVRRIAVVGIVFGILVQLTGVNAVMYYAPTILVETGLGTQAALTATVGNGIVSVLSVMLGIHLLGRRGRRGLVLVGEAGIVVSLAALGVCFALPQSSLRSYAVLVFMLTFLFFMQAFVGVVFWLSMSELFPLRVRGLVVGTAVFVQWLSNTAVTFSFPILIAHLGGPTFFIFAAINVGTFVFLWRFLPETRGLSLEEFERRLEDGTAWPATHRTAA